MKDMFNTKINVELTLEELENIIICLRAANKHNTGSVRNELEERLSNLSTNIKNWTINDEENYHKQELQKVIESLGANIGDKVVILKGGSGSYSANWDNEGEHTITNIDFTGNIEFDNGKAKIFRPIVKLIKL